MSSPATSCPYLSALYCYPVKSCRGVALQGAALDHRGILHDREFMVVDAQGCFMTQRATPAMARIATAIADDALRLAADGVPELRVPWHSPDRAQRQVTVWRDTVLADDAGDEAAAWLSDVLGQPCRLVAMGHDSRRDVPAARIPEVHRAALDQPVPVAFCDAFPLLVVSEESVADLNRRVGGDLPLLMDRFRPNLVFAGLRGSLRRGRVGKRIASARSGSSAPGRAAAARSRPLISKRWRGAPSRCAPSLAIAACRQARSCSART